MEDALRADVGLDGALDVPDVLVCGGTETRREGKETDGAHAHFFVIDVRQKPGWTSCTETFAGLSSWARMTPMMLQDARLMWWP